MTDSFGEGLMAYEMGDWEAKYIVESDIAETEEWPVSEFFHEYADMSEIEKRALAECKGRTLDVGAGSGSHSLWLQRHGVDVEALDISPKAIEVMRKRGVIKTHNDNYYAFKDEERYDTLLFMMNGSGISGNIDGLGQFLDTAKKLMKREGQIILDSSDLIYLYKLEDGSVELPLNRYYGEINYTISFNGHKSEPFDWLFIDSNTLKDEADRHGLKCEVIYEGEHYDYLCKLTEK